MTTEEAAAEALADDPPPGFRRYETRGAFTQANGPFYQRLGEGECWRGFRARARHCNSFGIVHGGMMMAFADGLLALAAHQATNAIPLTVRLTGDFVAAVRPGDWVEGHARAIARDGDLVHVAGEVFVAGAPVLTLGGLFRPMAARKRG